MALTETRIARHAGRSKATKNANYVVAAFWTVRADAPCDAGVKFATLHGSSQVPYKGRAHMILDAVVPLVAK